MAISSKNHQLLVPLQQLHPLLQDKYDFLCQIFQTYGIRKAYVFGSLARKIDFSDQSDVDLLLVWENKENLGLGYFDLWDELEKLFDRKVDIISHPKQLLNPYLREMVQKDIMLIYKQKNKLSETNQVA